jgi:hypothetical protein
VSVVDPWTTVTSQLRAYVEQNVLALLAQVGPTVTADNAQLNGRLLSVIAPPPGNALADLLGDIVGMMGVGSRVQLHGWCRDPQHAPADRGLAVVVVAADDPNRMAVAALTPGSTPGQAVIDAVVRPGAPIVFNAQQDPWSCNVTVDGGAGWDASSGPGAPVAPPAPNATIHTERKTPFTVGMTTGPGLSIGGFALTLTATPDTPTVVQVDLTGLQVALLPEEIARLLGARPDDAAAPDGSAGPPSITVLADHVHGVRFRGAGLTADLPIRLKLPAVESRGTQVGLSFDGSGLHLQLTTALTATLPGLPLRASLDHTGFELPLHMLGVPLPALGQSPQELTPDGINVDLTLPPVSGAGLVRHEQDVYSGLIAADLGVIAVQAIAQFRPPQGSTATSLLVLLGVIFPPPGIQLSFGFALDAVGGLVGINHRVDVDALRRLVSDGHADRVLFPDNITEQADAVIDALTSTFPSAAGRFVIAPMIRITWGARMVALSGALIVEVPAPVQALILGRLVINVPDPLVPLIHLQASVLGQFDPGVPEFDILVSLAGSWVVGLAVRGECYLLVRGGADPQFVVSAGGFHPSYVRPAGVPALDRLDMDLRPGGLFSMRIKAYFALTSSSVQFGGDLHLQAEIAGCGVEGWLGLDALFRYEPRFSFAVQIHAGVAVRAFKHTLASVGLSFTLEGPAPWHAAGTGSVSVLFWDASLDFDIGWGSPPPAVPAGPVSDPIPQDLIQAIANPKAWVIERPAADRTGLTFTDAATAEIAAGTLVHPDAALVVSQSVVPLGVIVERYGRHRIDPQQWDLTAISFSSLTDVASAEFFDLTDDEQLTAPGHAAIRSGAHTNLRTLQIEVAHRVDDGYQTVYEPPAPARLPTHWHGRYADEIGLPWRAAERLERWRADVVAPVQVSAATLQQITLSGPVHMFGATLAPATSQAPPVTVTPAIDTWQSLQQQALRPDPRTRLLESWETPV